MEYILIPFMVMIMIISALVLTLLLEAPVIWLGLGMHMHAEDKGKLVVNFLLINGITNITLNTCILAFGFFLSGPIGWGIVLLAELIIPIIEAKMYHYTTKEFSMKRLLVVCYLANVVSFLLGSWLLSFWG